MPEPKSVNGTVQTPIEGTSLVYAFNDAKAPERHKTQYFEMFGNRAIYNDGWLARTIHRAPWQTSGLPPLTTDVWDLYDVRNDFSLTKNLAAEQPKKLKEMQALFMKEAEKYHVLPIDDRTIERMNPALAGRPDVLGDRTSLTLYEGMQGMLENTFMNIKNRSSKITAELEIPAGRANGAILSQGGRFGGWSLYMKDGKPAYTYNFLGLSRYTVTAPQALPPGPVTVTLDFAYDGGGAGKGGKAPAAEPPAAEPPAEQPTEQAAAAKSVQAGDATAEKRTYKPIPPFVPTPETIDSKIGRLEFPGGYPSDETAQKLADEMLYVHGVSAYTDTIQGASLWAIRKGFADIGVKDNEFIVSPEMMDGRALFLTANMDTYYFWSNINLKDGPIVVETPPGVLGIFDDFWFRWISDFGLPGPDRGKGGRYLLVPPGYTGELPEGGYFINHSRTNLVTMIGRMFLEGNSTEISEKVVKENLKVYPYAEGGEGTSIGSYLQGGARLGKMAEPKAPRMVDVSGISINTLPPADFGHFEYVNALVQSEPASALDPEIAGQLAAIGIVKENLSNLTQRLEPSWRSRSRWL